MKAHLLYRDQDFDLQWPLPWNEEALTKDLALNTLFEAMAQGDKFVLEVIRRTILSGLRNDVATIGYAPWSVECLCGICAWLSVNYPFLVSRVVGGVHS